MIVMPAEFPPLPPVAKTPEFRMRGNLLKALGEKRKTEHVHLRLIHWSDVNHLLESKRDHGWPKIDALKRAIGRMGSRIAGPRSIRGIELVVRESLKCVDWNTVQIDEFFKDLHQRALEAKGSTSIYQTFPSVFASRERMDFSNVGWTQLLNHCEDRYFFYDIVGKGRLLGVFDGHGGADVANYSSVQFANVFEEKLSVAPSVLDAFEETFYELQNRLKDNRKGVRHERCGAAAVVVYIDTRCNKAYTATLGDCEALVLRKRSEEPYQAIPLSQVLSWNDKQEFQRLMDHVWVDYGKFCSEHGRVPSDDDRSGLENHFSSGCRKLRSTIRFIVDPANNGFTYNITGVDVSRSLGDTSRPAVSQKPKVTECSLMPGDTVLLFSDGLWKSVDPQQLIKAATEAASGSPQELCDKILSESDRDQDGNPHDDITLLALQVRAISG